MEWLRIKRPVIVITLGFLIGIIYGLYFEKSIAFVLLFIYLIYLIQKRFSKKHNFCKYKICRYIKIFFNINIITIFFISAFISNTYIKYLNKNFQKVYKNNYNSMVGNAVIISNIEEKEYTYKYIVKIRDDEFKNKKFILYVKKNDKNKFNYGDRIKFEGKYFKPDGARNYHGFDYDNYLKTKKIFGTIKVDNIEFIKEKDLNFFSLYSNIIRNSIIEKIKQILPEDSSNLLIGILLGIKDNISEDIINNFKNSNLSHLLAVSGMHTTYLILRSISCFKKKQNSKKLDIFNYWFFTNYFYVHNKFYIICNKSMFNGNNRN